MGNHALAQPRTYTRPDVFTIGVAEGWAEAETDPTRIDWPERQARAAIPFEVVDRRPVNPCATPEIRYGRNGLGLWGENLMADALVTATHLGCRYLLMVERADGYGWAVPGGAADPGETGAEAALRELAEETGLYAQMCTHRVMTPRYIPDPRASCEAWAVTQPVHTDLGQCGSLPLVTGADDARRAEWLRAGSYEDLTATLGQVYGGSVFAAHQAMLREFLGGEGMTGKREAAAVEIVSSGCLHGPPPPADITLDLRHAFKDPHVNPELRYLDATDPRVRDAVQVTPGIAGLCTAAAVAVQACLSGPGTAKIVLAVGCAGGRHRAPSVAMEIAARLEAAGIPVTVTHRDIGKPVVTREPS